MIRFWKHKSSWIPVLVALLLTLALAALQYQWVGQATSAEQEGMQERLRTGAAHFSDDFDRELTRAYLSFQMDATTLRDEAWIRYARRYSHWVETAPYPGLVGDVFLVQVDSKGQISLSHFNTTTGRFESELGDWPPQLMTLRRRFIRAYQATFVDADLGVGNPLEPIAEEVPALVIPLSHDWLLTDRQQRGYNAEVLFSDPQVTPLGKGCWTCPSLPRSRNEPLFAYTIATLDRSYLQREFIPSLAGRYFSSDGALDYNLSIVSRGNPHTIIYQSDPQQARQANTSGDAAIGLLSLRLDEFNRLLLDVALRQGEVSDGGTRRNDRIAIGILGPTPSQESAAGTSLMGDNNGLWQLVLTHRAGSLAAAVAELRLRRLLIGFGVLLLLAVSMTTVIISTRRAQRLAQQKMEFVAAISHELRTPLAVICSAGENLADGVIPDPRRARQYGAVIHGEGRRLAEMVEQILEFAGAQSGHTSYQLCPVEIGDLVEGALAACQPELEKGCFCVEKQIQPDLPPVLADAPALRRSIQNLLNNAMKYGGERPWIGVYVRAKAAGHRAEVQITVQDRGQGIAPADLLQIFEPFYRGQAAIGAQIHGSGLGLSLVKNIVEAHNGRVTVESVAGRGSAFTLHLPAL